MSAYTLRGSEALDARIRADLERISEAASPHSTSGILLGGYGRGEGTPFINPDGTQSPFNDYDIVAVVDKLDPPARDHFQRLGQVLSAELGVDVDLCPYERGKLCRCEFSLLNYEMKYGHRVLWGDEHVLDAMPAYPHNAIPPSEGSRLLLNRGKLLLDTRRRLARPDPLDNMEQIRYLMFISKAWLALGDCVLLAEGRYDVAYRVKSERISAVGDVPHRAAVVEQYLDAVQLKEWGDYPARLQTTNLESRFRHVRDVFIDVFSWYRQLYSTYECPIPKAMLLNLKWNRWPYLEHPRVRLYDALQELLKDTPDKFQLGQVLSCSRDFEKKFYELQARFS